jgi:hypothetical protein
MQQVIITIEDGTPIVEVKCVKGQVCKKLTEDLVKALGDTVESNPTAEFYEQAKQTIKAGR